jgi:hypothetical protein
MQQQQQQQISMAELMETIGGRHGRRREQQLGI